jgi:cardiolipin synthase
MLEVGGWFYLVEWALRLVMIPVVAHRRERPIEVIAWLAVIFLLPVFGTLVYLWLGEFSFRRGEARHREARRRAEALHPHDGAERYAARNGEEEIQRPLVRVAEALVRGRLSAPAMLGGNEVELLQEGEVVDRLVGDVEAARSHVHLLVYMYVDDDTGWRVARALAAASERGVRCRLLADAWASRSMFRAIHPWLAGRGVEVHGLLKIEPLRRPLSRFDVRNHRKLAVIDGRIAYTGSSNIHDPDFDLEEGVWHQVTARVAGPAVHQLQSVFLEDWYMATEGTPEDGDLFPEPDARGEVPVLAFPSGPAYPHDALQHLFTEILHDARERVVLTTPYFVPDEPTLLALRLAALRGVEVDVAVPERSDRRLADAAGRAYFGALLEAGVRVHLHPSGILHAKTLSVDESFAVVGSANFDRRSFFVNYEILLLMHHRGTVRALRELQGEYLRRSRTLDPEVWKERPTLRSIVDDTARILSPVL